MCTPPASEVQKWIPAISMACEFEVLGTVSVDSKGF